MAHSIQVVGDGQEVFNDLDLLVLVCFLIQGTKDNRDEYASLQSFTHEWSEGIDGYGPGTLDLNLQSIVTVPSAKQELERLLDTLSLQMKDVGSTIPLSLLKMRIEIPGVTLCAPSRPNFLQTIDKIRRLLAGESN